MISWFTQPEFKLLFLKALICCRHNFRLITKDGGKSGLDMLDSSDFAAVLKYSIIELFASGPIDERESADCLQKISLFLKFALFLCLQSMSFCNQGALLQLLQRS